MKNERYYKMQVKRKIVMIMFFALFLILLSACNDSVDNKVKDSRLVREQQIENLQAFAKLYGYVRFFTPATKQMQSTGTVLPSMV